MYGHGRTVRWLGSRSQVRIPAMTLPGYFWDRWPYFAGKLSWDITTTQVNSALHLSAVAKSSTSFCWGKGGKVTSTGWRVTLCDLIWHVISRSGVVISITNCYIRLTYFTVSGSVTRNFFKILKHYKVWNAQFGSYIWKKPIRSLWKCCRRCIFVQWYPIKFASWPHPDSD